MMKKIFFVLVVMFFTNASRAQNDIVVDPNATLRTLNGDFNTIKVSGGIDLYLSQSDNIAIAVSASKENYKEGIRTVIENGTLKIFYEGEKNWKQNDRKLRVYVSFIDLKKIEATGACDVIVSGSLSVAALEIEMSGACDFTGRVKVNDLKIDLSGASDIKISGTADKVDIENSGASDVKGYDLVTDYCNAKATGASDIKITVNKELTAHATGASDIMIKGAALIKEMNSSGASSIKIKN
jgi:Putative auto-transporter adhesin, head GIN domain